MQTLPRNINPFALMLDPQAVIAQIERSQRLEGLHRRVCRPLDKPLLGGTVDEASDGADPSASVAGIDDDNGARTDGSAEDQRADGALCGAQRHD